MEDPVIAVCDKCKKVKHYENFKEMFADGWDLKLNQDLTITLTCKDCEEKNDS